jgi:hypothetical protein
MSKKSTICFLFLIVNLSLSYGQVIDKKDKNQYTFAELEIKDVRINDIEYTEEFTNNKNNFYFYKIIDSNQIYFSNHFEVIDSQSYGRIYNVVREHFDETDDTYEKDIYKFKWSYVNTYDDVKGTAYIILSLEYKYNGIYFELIMNQDDLDVNKYKGEFKGSVSFFEYLQDKTK